MDNLKYISFEITNKCNLSHVHCKCPINDSLRYNNCITTSNITELDISLFITFALANGFKGCFAFHYYNEPLIEKEKMLNIVNEFKDKANFSLWTNGLLLPRESLEQLEFLKLFKEVVITNYDNYDYSTIMKHYNNIRLNVVNLDDRLEQPEEIIDIKNLKCDRATFELIIDYYGNGHICCGDYENNLKIGNIKYITFTVFLNNWYNLKNKLNNWDSENYGEIPDICKLCNTRTPNLKYTKDYLK